MVRSIGAQVALFAFGAAVLAGVLAGNSPTTVLRRGLVALLAGMAIGQIVAWTTKLVLRDYLLRKKLVIDREHFASTRAAAKAQEVDEEEAEAPVVAETRLAHE